MSPTRYTALIRTFNSARTLPKTLASLQAQTLPPSAWVIVDSGSTDGTLGLLPEGAIVHRYVGRRFNYAEALNQGLDLVDTECVLIISSHTSLGHPGALGFALDILDRDPQVGAAYFCYERCPALQCRLIERGSFTGFNGLWNTCSMIRTSLLKQRRFRPEVFAAEDQEWSSWLLHSEGKAIARLSGAALENDNPQRFAWRKLLDEYAAVALFTNRSLLGWPHLLELAARAARPSRPLALRERLLHLALFARLLACHVTRAGIGTRPQKP